MAADTLSLRLRELCALHVQGDSLEPLMADVLPLVEQAIQQEREKAEIYERTARDMANNCEFYRGLVIRCGEVFGVEARTSDDGSVQQDVLALKVPELVEAQARSLAEKDAQIDIWRSVSERADRLLAERQADRDNWHSRAHELATECERRAGEIGEKDAQIAALRAEINEIVKDEPTLRRLLAYRRLRETPAPPEP